MTSAPFSPDHAGRLRNRQCYAFIFTGNITGALLGIITGNQYADVLAGAPVETQYFTLVPKNDGKSIYYGFYAQDEWKAMPNLTVSYGVRYEYHPAYHDTREQSATSTQALPERARSFIRTAIRICLIHRFLPISTPVGTGPRTVEMRTVPPCSPTARPICRAACANRKKIGSCRASGSWRPFNDDKTAVRAGFGVYNTTLLGSIFFALTDTLQAASLVYQNSINPDTGARLRLAADQPPVRINSPTYGTASFNTANKIDWKDPTPCSGTYPSITSSRETSGRVFPISG